MNVAEASAPSPAPAQIGPQRFDPAAMRGRLEEFARLYAVRPLPDNSGGMSSAHLFLFWYVLTELAPRAVLESGVWRGQGTWLIEQACPHAEIHCIDINYANLRYRSERATYHEVDFTQIDWSGVPRDETVVFFDDHINALDRVRQCRERGFKHLLFEDNYYSSEVSDVYSLKLALAGQGFRYPDRWRYWLGILLGRHRERDVAANTADAEWLARHLEIYQELPPVFRPELTRWGTPFSQAPTAPPLLEEVTEPWQQVYRDEAKAYNWMAYVKLP